MIGRQVAGIIVACAVLCVASLAAADASWTSPDNHIRLVLPDGWTEIADPARPPEDYALIAASPAMAARGEDCIVIAAVGAGIFAQTQGQMNRASESITVDQMLAPQDIRHGFANEMLSGVRVISFDVEHNGVRLLERHFGLSDREAPIHYILSCQLSPDAPDDIAASAQMLSSLRIRR